MITHGLEITQTDGAKTRQIGASRLTGHHKSVTTPAIQDIKFNGPTIRHRLRRIEGRRRHRSVILQNLRIPEHDL
jgi:hypothetical protein